MSFMPTQHLLFRFSALTFNAHKIHFDPLFTQHKEKYPGLLCHGPMSLVLLLELLRVNVLDTGKDRTWRVRQFDYRCLAPMYVDQVRTHHFLALIYIRHNSVHWLPEDVVDKHGRRLAAAIDSRIKSVAARSATRRMSCGQRRRRAGIVSRAWPCWKRKPLEQLPKELRHGFVPNIDDSSLSLLLPDIANMKYKLSTISEAPITEFLVATSTRRSNINQEYYTLSHKSRYSKISKVK